MERNGVLYLSSCEGALTPGSCGPAEDVDHDSPPKLSSHTSFASSTAEEDEGAPESTYSKASIDSLERPEGYCQRKTIQELRAAHLHCIRTLRANAARAAAEGLFAEIAQLHGKGPALGRQAGRSASLPDLPLFTSKSPARQVTKAEPAGSTTARSVPECFDISDDAATGLEGSGELEEHMLDVVRIVRRETSGQIAKVRRTMKAQARQVEALRRQQEPLAKAVRVLILALALSLGTAALGWRRASKLSRAAPKPALKSRIMEFSSHATRGQSKW